jgi:hypothetical protein
MNAQSDDGSFYLSGGKHATRFCSSSGILGPPYPYRNGVKTHDLVADQLKIDEFNSKYNIVIDTDELLELLSQVSYASGRKLVASLPDGNIRSILSTYWLAPSIKIQVIFGNNQINGGGIDRLLECVQVYRDTEKACELGIGLLSVLRGGGELV